MPPGLPIFGKLNRMYPNFVKPALAADESRLFDRTTPVDWPWIVGVDGDAASLAALAREGWLRPFTDTTYLATDCAPSRRSRAAALAGLVPDRGVVARNTAAWMWGAHDVWHSPLCVFVPTRYEAHKHCTRLARTVAPEEKTELAGVVVTTPVRTVADLLDVPGDVEVARDIVYLLTEKTTPEQVAEYLDNKPASGKNTRAKHRLASFTSIHL